MPPIRRTTAPLGILVRSDIRPPRVYAVGGRREPNGKDLVLLRQVMLGHTNVAIGHSLGLSGKTVKNRLTNLYAMFHAQSRTDLVMRAIRGGYLACPCRCRCAKGRARRLHRPPCSVLSSCGQQRSWN